MVEKLDIKTTKHISFHRPTVIFLAGTFLSYPWELVQAPLYVGGSNFSKMVWHCFLASLGDGLFMVTIYIVGLLVFHNGKWFEKLDITRYLFTFLFGFSISTIFEWVAIGTNIWNYSTNMPVIPILNVGINILLYALLLPPAVFHIATVWLRKYSNTR